MDYSEVKEHHSNIQSMRFAQTDALLLATLDCSSDRGVEVFLHSHSEYEILIPYAPMPCLIMDNAIYFGEVGYAYPAAAGVVHGAKKHIKNASYLDILIDKDYFDHLLDELWTGTDFTDKFKVNDRLRQYVSMFYAVYNSVSRFKVKQLDSLARLICTECVELETITSAHSSCNVSNFTPLFKKHMGLTPLAFR